MVVFVDLDDDAFNQHQFQAPDALLHGCIKPENPSMLKSSTADLTGPSGTQIRHDDSGQTKQGGAFSAALSCYPIVREIARSVDLTTLDALSRTCRQFHLNLIPYRQQLVKRTLRCENEYVETVADLLQNGTAIPDSVKSVLHILNQGSVESGRLTRGKVAKCARDMVGECRKCSKVVCRNCTIKSPTSTMLKNRIRRLCTTCRTVPISCHFAPFSPPHTPHPHNHSHSPSREPTPPLIDPSSFTAAAFLRTPCTCDEAVWLCHQCGHTVRANDTTYRRVWAWRTRYSTYLGGLGTGIGEGCQGVKCGRGEDCLASHETELEVVSEADEDCLLSSDQQHLHNHHGRLSPPPNNDTNHSNTNTNASTPDEEEPGYFRQEIIGIGGRFKQKVKKRVLVGACVVEYEDERDSGNYLTREEQGLDRAWCGWCWRVIASKDDR